jgi:hypothetical protein
MRLKPCDLCFRLQLRFAAVVCESIVKFVHCLQTPLKQFIDWTIAKFMLCSL